MKRMFGHVVSLLAVGMAVSTAVPACATNDQTIFIQGALAPPSSRVNGVCTYTPDPQASELLRGTVDLGVTDSYSSILLVGNQLITRADPANNRAESNRVHINGAVVRVTETNGALIREFTSVATGLANPGSNGVPGFSLAGVVALDAPTRDILLPQLPNRAASKTVLAFIKVFGITLGGKDVESGEFQFPIQVCNGCLVDFSTGNDDTQKIQPNCLKVSTGTAATQSPCMIGQDEVVKCELCVRSRKVCDPLTP
jgi:hypothetical protein